MCYIDNFFNLRSDNEEDIPPTLILLSASIIYSSSTVITANVKKSNPNNGKRIKKKKRKNKKKKKNKKNSSYHPTSPAYFEITKSHSCRIDRKKIDIHCLVDMILQLEEDVEQLNKEASLVARDLVQHLFNLPSAFVSNR